MGDRLQLALDESSKTMQLPILAEHAKYGNIEGKNPKNKCIVVLTSGSIQIREESKTVKLKSNYVWYDLIKMAINFPLIQLTFKQSENNESNAETLIIEIIESKGKTSNSKNQKENNPNYQSFIQSLSDILQRVLTPFELKRISFDSVIHTEKVKPTYVSIMSRLTMILSHRNQQISQMSIEAFKSMLFSFQPEFNLSAFKDSENIIPALLELIPLINYIEVIKIPVINNFKVYKASAYFLFQLNNIKYIEIGGRKDDGFESFLKKLQSSNVKTISYTSSNFSAQDLDLISTAILDSNIHCLEFHDAINENDNSSFYSSFLTQNMSSHLWSLNLNNTNNLNLPTLLQKLENISSLSLAYCRIEINSTIRLIHKSNMQYLKYLNLSGNLCNETLDMSITLSNNLTHIMVNDVSWNDKSLTTFISLVLQLTKNEKNQKIHSKLSKKSKDLYLSISHAITLQHEWSRLFQLLHMNFSSSRNESFIQFRTNSHSSYNFSELRNAIANDDDEEDRFYPVVLRSLAWDENPVDTAFFDFLRENKELETLSLNSCFHETLESSLALFVDYIKANDNLKKLFVAGSKKVHLGKKVIKVIDACLNKKNLKVLDLSFSKCDSDCLREFLPLFDERKSALDVVILDGVFPSESDKFVDFLNQIKLMRSGTKISFPNNDCLNLKKQKKITQKQMDEINKIYKEIEGGGSDEAVKANESEEEKSASSLNNNSSDSKSVVSVKTVKNSGFLKQPYFYRYFYEPFIPYYLDLNEIKEIHSNKFDVDDENEDEEKEIKDENTSKNVVIKTKKDKNDDENENDDFTLLPAESGLDEEEENNENKTFTIQLADFESNVDENEEEEEEGESDEAVQIELGNQNMQEAKYEFEEDEIDENNDNQDNLNNIVQKKSPQSDSSSKKSLKRIFQNVNDDELNQEKVIKVDINKNEKSKSPQEESKKKSPKKNPMNENDEETEEEEEENIDNDNDNEMKNSKGSKSSKSSKKNSPLVVNNNNKQLKQPMKKVFANENSEENEINNGENITKKNKNLKLKKSQVNRSKKPLKRNAKKVLRDENDDNDRQNEVSKRKTLRSNKNKKQIKQISKKQVNDEIEEDEDEIEASNRKIIKQRTQQVTRIKKQIKQTNKKVYSNQNDNENDSEEEEEVEIKSNQRRIVKPKNQQQINKNKKQIKQISKQVVSDDENIEEDEEEDLYSQQLNNNISSESDEANERTEVNDSFMNVTIGVNDLNNNDGDDSYEEYEIINQFTTPRQARSSNLNRNVSHNKNKNYNQVKNSHDKNRNRNNSKKSVKSNNQKDDNYENDENDFQLSSKTQKLINNFTIQYNLGDSEIKFQGFETSFDNTDFWTNMNNEFSIDKLFKNVKTIKETKS